MIEIVLLALLIAYTLVTDVVVPLLRRKEAKVGNPMSLREAALCLEILKNEVQDMKIRLSSLESDVRELQLALTSYHGKKAE